MARSFPAVIGPAPSVAAVVALIAAGSGCSLIFVDGPPANHAERPFFDCTSGRLAPVGDLAVAGIFGVAVLGAATASSQDPDRVTGVAGSAIVAAGMAASSIYGWSKTSKCRQAKAALADRLTDGTRPAFPFARAPRPDPWLAAGPPPEFVPASAPPSIAEPTGPRPAAPNRPSPSAPPQTTPVRQP